MDCERAGRWSVAIMAGQSNKQQAVIFVFLSVVIQVSVQQVSFETIYSTAIADILLRITYDDLVLFVRRVVFVCNLG